MNQLPEIVGARDKVGFAVHLDQYAKLRPGVDVTADDALPGRAGALLAGGGDAAFAQYHFGFGQVAVGLVERLLALHHSGAGALT